MTTLQQAADALKLGDLDTAIKLYADVLSIEPKNPFALHYMGLIDIRDFQKESGITLMEESLSILPDNPAFNHNIAGFYSQLGDVEKARFHFQKAIDLKPDYGEAYQGLTESKSCENEADLLEKINRQLDTKSVSDIQKSYMSFAAGKICADAKNYDLAFFHYNNANRLKNVSFNIKKHQNNTEDKILYFNKQWSSSNRGFGLNDAMPIFIVGMPRSGTTLTEQILSSHSSVYGAGELLDISIIAGKLRGKVNLPDPIYLDKTDDMDLLGFGYTYLSRLKTLSDNQKYVVNKLPQNFLNIGLIRLMFPNARIIHVKRDPVDTCLSCYFKNFSQGHNYTFNLKHLGAYYHSYQKLMNHWQDLMPEIIHTVSYEDLVNNQEDTTRGLLEYCNLPWEDGCLSFHKNDRRVATASRFQVRKPMYKEALNSSAVYQSHLNDLVQAINNG